MKIIIVPWVLVTFWFLPFAAQAHHVLGLPHYSYLKEYPQVPRLDLETQVGRYFAVCTVMPGNPKPGETFRVHIYVKNTVTGMPYERKMEFVIREKAFFGQGLEVFRFTQNQTDDHQFKQSAKVQAAGEYLVGVAFTGDDGIPHTIEFPLQIGQPSWFDRLLPVLLGGVGVLLLLMGQRWLGRRRTRRKPE